MTPPYTRAGEGPPEVVLLHAGVTDRRAWWRLGTSLWLAEHGHAVVMYDRRGFGDAPPGGHGTDVDELLALLGELDARAPVWLVGSSMGGAVAIDAALTVPERVAGLVLLAPAVSGAPEPDDVALDPATARVAALLEEADEAGDLDAVNRYEAWLWLDGPASEEGRVGGRARELFLAMNGIALANDAGDRESEVDAYARLEELRCPVTVAWGDLDVPFVLDRCAEVAARVPAARTHVFAGMAHLPYLERSDEVADVVHGAIAQAATP